MNFVFYHPKTLEIKWQSDRDDVMSFPFIQTEEKIYPPNYTIGKIGKKLWLIAIKNQYTDEEWQAITNPQ